MSSAADLTADSLLELLELMEQRRYPARLAAQSAAGGILFVDVDEIDWIDAAGKQCRLNCGGRTYIVRESIGTLAEELDPELFYRIHRSTLVNVDRIREIRPRGHGGHLVVLEGGVKLNVTRAARTRLLEQMLCGPGHSW